MRTLSTQVWAALLTLLLAGWARPAFAASPDSTRTPAANASSLPVAAGTLLRLRPSNDLRGIVRVGRPMFRGTFERASAESLWVTPVGDLAAVSLPLAEVQVERYAGRSHVNGFFAGGAIGLFVGLGAGALAAVTYMSRGDDEIAEFAYIVGPLVGAMVGVPIGAAVGAARGIDRWERVE